MTPEESLLKNQEWMRLNENRFISALDGGACIEDLITTAQAAAACAPLGRLTCCDPRIPCDGMGKIAIAGSLLLAPPEQVERFLKEHGRRIEKVESHDGCRAAVIAFEQLQAEGELPAGIDTPEALAAYFAAGIARRVGVPHQHLAWDDLITPTNTARMVWVDATGCFRPELIADMPPHFIGSAAGFGFDEDYVYAEVEVLLAISLGPPGFGHRFDEKHPLYVLVAAPTEDEAQNLAGQISGQLQSEVCRVKVQALAVPRPPHIPRES